MMSTTMMKTAMLLLLSVHASTSAAATGSIFNCKSFIAMHSNDPDNRCFEASSMAMIQTLALPVIRGWEEKDDDNNSMQQQQSQRSQLRGSKACLFDCHNNNNKDAEYSQNRQQCQVLAPCNTLFQDDTSSPAAAIVESLAEDGDKTGMHFQRVIAHLIGHKCNVDNVTFEIWQKCHSHSTSAVALTDAVTGGDSSLQQVQ